MRNYLQEIQITQATVSCPICRKGIGRSCDVTTLPNSNPTLYIINRLEENRKQDEKKKEKVKVGVESLDSSR